MAARATASATIAFGLVSIPVKLFSTTDSTHAVKFNTVTADGIRLRQQMIRDDNGEVVNRADHHKGFDDTKGKSGRMLVFTPEEVAACDAPVTKAVDIAEFIPIDQVDRLFVEKSYFLAPDKEPSARAYHLLRQALETTGRAAIGRYAVRGKDYLVAIRHMPGGLVMEQLKHAAEMRSFDEVAVPGADVSDDEMSLAVGLVEQHASDEFQPEQYTDGTRERLIAAVEAKRQGAEVIALEQPEPKPIGDLMQALKASIAA